MIARFLDRQLTRMRAGGPAVLIRKALAVLLLWPLVPVVLMIRLSRPFVLIRFVSIPSNRFGNFALAPEKHLSDRDAGLHPPRAMDLFYLLRPVSNLQLKKMWGRTLHVSRFYASLNRVNHWLPGGGAHVTSWPNDWDIDRAGIMAQTRAHLTFTPKEQRKGEDEIKRLGINPSVPFVCFHARDPSYMESILPGTGDTDVSAYRNCSIQNYMPAAEELTRRGYFAIRVGAVVVEPLNTNNPMIIDYASKYRTDFLDIYLGANCRFYLGCDSGPVGIPAIFRRPVIWCNSVPLENLRTWDPRDLCIPRKQWLRSEQRFLTVREIIDLGSGGALSQTEDYKQRGIEPIENTPEEILDIAVEMDERLKGTWQTTEEDEELQRQFWSLFPPSEWQWQAEISSRIGADFLRQNRELLD